MAKKRQSVFSAGASKQEIEKEAKKVEKKVDGKSTGKKMHLYVDEDHHQTAKINAAKRGMKLSEYIEFIIREDKP
jgi:predicted HicB family RNase H-like nuclease